MLCFFQQKVELHSNQNIKTKIVNLVVAKITTSTRTDINLQTSVTILRAITMCGTFSPIYWCDNSFIKIFRKVCCSNTMCLAIFFMTRSFSLTWKNQQYSRWRTNKFVFLKFDRVINICERMQKSIQDVIGDLYCPTSPKREMSISIFEENIR